MRIPRYVIFLIVLVSAMAQAQLLVEFVASSDAPDATGYNNSHKIAPKHSSASNDTINVVFHSSDSVYFVFTNDGGQSWSNPAAVYQGGYPAIDVCHMGLRHLTWQTYDPTHNTHEIYYDCIDDWHIPINISQSAGQSVLPDLVVDSNGVVHIVWVEEMDGYTYIYYRTVWQYTLGDTVRLSNFGTNEATYSHPSISIFWPGDRIYAIWECYDSLCYSPYQIHLRYNENDTWSATTSWAHYLPMRHPSLDYSHGEDTISFCYEDSTSGNMEAAFHGGNGGGYPTPGHSTYPVVSTVSDVWSYLFWQEDSAEHNTVYYHLYYQMSGWTRGSLSWIQETVRFPSVSGAYALWTQGDEPPYSIYFADFGYPIGVRGTEERTVTRIDAAPNPFREATRFTIERTEAEFDVRLQVFDVSGRLVKEFKTTVSPRGSATLLWQGDDLAGNALPAGVYWCCMEDNDNGLRPLLKVTKIR
ncbi:hypothetical protein IBX73_05260 [candidate division WOR-3 bacterium]|nr:hypothetical protein [candidate division WOR-3 bacterium]